MSKASLNQLISQSNMDQDTIHQPVLISEVISLLSPEPGKKYIDATIGGGGHTSRLLQAGATVLGFDQDSQAIDHVKHRFPGNQNLSLAETNFIAIRSKAEQLGFSNCQGILFDLGVSSLQLDTPSRGFSFNYDAPLDMRMNQNTSQTAADLVNNMAEDELYEILITHAQEDNARQIAKAIVNSRPITSTKQLADLVVTCYPPRRGHLHPATKTFQAIRIAVNQELKIIGPTLKDALTLLKPQGRLLVISFHEGEDRIVKRTFSEMEQTGQVTTPGKQPIVPQTAEIAANPRARSAKLRYIERL